jgi:hypothetical protein
MRRPVTPATATPTVCGLVRGGGGRGAATAVPVDDVVATELVETVPHAPRLEPSVADVDVDPTSTLVVGLKLSVSTVKLTDMVALTAGYTTVEWLQTFTDVVCDITNRVPL